LELMNDVSTGGRTGLEMDLAAHRGRAVEIRNTRLVRNTS